jgi:hypothetical protein
VLDQIHSCLRARLPEHGESMLVLRHGCLSTEKLLLGCGYLSRETILVLRSGYLSREAILVLRCGYLSREAILVLGCSYFSREATLVLGRGCLCREKPSLC